MAHSVVDYSRWDKIDTDSSDDEGPPPPRSAGRGGGGGSGSPPGRLAEGDGGAGADKGSADKGSAGADVAVNAGMNAPEYSALLASPTARERLKGVFGHGLDALDAAAERLDLDVGQARPASAPDDPPFKGQYPVDAFGMSQLRKVPLTPKQAEERVVDPEVWPLLHGWGVKCLFFDLDDTLYREPQFPAAVRENIARYMVEKLGYDPAGVRERMLQLYEKHGTTALGLCKEDGKSLDWNDWHKDVHWGSLDYELLKKQPLKALKDLLDSIPFQKIIFTNADKIHALKCLEAMGLTDCFDGLIAFENLQIMRLLQLGEDNKLQLGEDDPRVVAKPQPEAFEAALRMTSKSLPWYNQQPLKPSEVIFLDDSTRNCRAAKAAGIKTVLVGKNIAEVQAMGPAARDICNIAISDLSRLKDALRIVQSGTVAW